VLLQTGWVFVKKISVPTAGFQQIFHRKNLFYVTSTAELQIDHQLHCSSN